MSSNKVIVITGASGGIGAALARQLGAQGHRLALAARREKELAEVAAECGPGTLAVVTDVTRRPDVERLRDRALAAFGQVDVWINNAGRGIGKPTLEVTDEDFDEIMAVNVKSALYGMQAIVPHFQERGAGHLVNVSSFLGRVPLASFRSIYSAAKAALNSLTANLRMDLRREYPGIHVSLVMPGLVNTGFAEKALGGTPPGPPPTGPMQPQTAEEVAAAIANLIEHPAPELYTHPASPEIARRYYADIGAFEASFGLRSA
jgi:NAD(P)-dependent dehydrogenase (short-subunit alcohol dehydrogenase family)